jgi:hypothetical protein
LRVNKAGPRGPTLASLPDFMTLPRDEQGLRGPAPLPLLRPIKRRWVDGDGTGTCIEGLVKACTPSTYFPAPATVPALSLERARAALLT